MKECMGDPTATESKARLEDGSKFCLIALLCLISTSNSATSYSLSSNPGSESQLALARHVRSVYFPHSFTPFFPRANIQRHIRAKQGAPTMLIKSRSLPKDVVEVPLVEQEDQMEQGEAGHKEAIHPNQYEKHSLEWNMAMIKLLLAMKKGDQDQEVEEELLVNNEIPMKLKEAEITTAPKAQGPVICKMKPFNICYRINPQGQSVHTGGNRRPVRLLRVYR